MNTEQIKHKWRPVLEYTCGSASEGGRCRALNDDEYTACALRMEQVESDVRLKDAPNDVKSKFLKIVIPHTRRIYSNDTEPHLTGVRMELLCTDGRYELLLYKPFSLNEYVTVSLENDLCCLQNSLNEQIKSALQPPHNEVGTHTLDVMFEMHLIINNITNGLAVDPEYVMSVQEKARDILHV